jgi:hypothetical protein
MGQIYGGLSGTGTVLCWTEWQWDSFIVDRVALGQNCGGLSSAATKLWWTEWHWDIYGGLSSNGAYLWCT